MASIIGILVTLAVCYNGVYSQQQRYNRQIQSHVQPCDQSSCYPATGDLMIGRQDRLTSSSTCGLERPERYCIVSHLEDRDNKCFVCDSRQPYSAQNKMSHRIENIVQTFKRDWKLRWWQAQNGAAQVSIQLDLEAEFHFTHLIMTFKTFRPSAMLIERSYDFGKTWKVYRYFAYDCAESFPGIPTMAVARIQDVICSSRYSDVAPSAGGEVIFRVLPANVEIEDPYAEEVQDLLKMTNLRVNFTKLHTLGDNLLDNRPEIKEKYYYSLYHMVVRGSCSCYGHASKCLPLPGQEDNPNMVHGKCECTHNTKGLNCEQCEDFYNDLPWRPARGRETNACKRCECNGHSTRCHFDPAVYEATGRVSGGVCDDCQHNTMGHHCEECKPFYYPDPSKDISDPHVCIQCDCDPIGSEHGGECESRTDHAHGLVAGRCLCKRFVEGRRCDRCRDGYWNMKADNPDGCEPCGCNIEGTVGNMGCDKTTGECHCKRFVAGRQCNECPPGYWGLGTDPQGCQPCNCDAGGAYDGNCDLHSGQCRCRPNIMGRHCDQVRPGYFVPSMDWMRYEGEFARGIGRTRVENRTPTPGRPVTWTGPGFMRCNQGDALEFTIDNIPYSMEYDIIVRYESGTQLDWDDVQMTIVRPGPVDQRGPCANSIPQDDRKAVTISRGGRHFLTRPSTCLEKGVTYTIKIDFNRYSYRGEADASVLIDSIVLMPSANGNPIFQPSGGQTSQRLREEYQRYRCHDNYIGVGDHQSGSEICLKIIFSSSAAIHDGAKECRCNPMGSESSDCATVGGQCRCKPNVIGRQCDQCAPGTWGFGPAGCTLCECSTTGSLDANCDPHTGQCKCAPNSHGRQCSSCQRGFYGFPHCRPCQCSGRSDECDDSGRCLQCRDNTGGQNCDRCADGYYGDPQTGCRACMCPGPPGSPQSHGRSCRLDHRTNQVICDCEPGYTGEKCDRCAENYYGDARTECRRCDCSGNIDHSQPGSCDPRTGQCLRCLYNTEGPRCERCKSGFFGDASRQNCQMCVCNILGTRRDAGSCDPVTGQCQCLPHVVGRNCDQCEPNYWKLASGTGCEMCNCDPQGSFSTQCNEFDGQCQCRPDRGGRDCRDCPNNQWGDPRSGCRPCECNYQGSANNQCDKRTGACQCAPGVTGDRCDRCARGTTGSLPNCVPCGECFDNWDEIISGIRNETNILIIEGGNIKTGGASGAFEREFIEMERQLNEVRIILNGTGVSEGGIEDLKRQLEFIRINLTTSSVNLDKLDGDIRGTNDRVETANNRIEEIRRRIEILLREAKMLRDNATGILVQEPSGAYSDIQQSYERSRNAQIKVDSTRTTITRSEYTRQQVDQLIRSRQAEFDRNLGQNDVTIRELNITIAGLNSKIVDLNEIVCDGRGDPCDPVCGGAGCGKCGGGLSCQDGAVSKATSAQDYSRRAETLLRDKQQLADENLREISSARDLCDMAHGDAQIAHDRAQTAKNESEGARADLQALVVTIEEFLNTKGATPREIREVAEEVLRMTISLTPDQIRELARRINETIRGLTNIDEILRLTRADLERVKALEKRANDAKKAAEDILRTAQRIIELLRKAAEAQDAAETAISSTRVQISQTEQDLSSIERIVTETNEQSNTTLIRVIDLRARVNALKQKFIENEVNVQRAAAEAKEAEDLANKAERDANELEVKYTEVSRQLDLKYNETRIAKEKADALKDRASTMFTSISQKVANLRSWEREFKTKEETLTNILGQIGGLQVNMVQLVVSIKDAERYLRTCGTA